MMIIVYNDYCLTDLTRRHRLNVHVHMYVPQQNDTLDHIYRMYEQYVMRIAPELRKSCECSASYAFAEHTSCLCSNFVIKLVSERFFVVLYYLFSSIKQFTVNH